MTIATTLQTGTIPTYLGALAALAVSGACGLCAAVLTFAATYQSLSAVALRNASVVLSSLAIIGASAGLFIPMSTLLPNQPSIAGVTVTQPGIALASTGLVLTFVLNILSFYGRLAIAAPGKAVASGSGSGHVPPQHIVNPAAGAGGGALPPGWKEQRTESGEIYYDNLITGVTQWDRPTY